MIGQSVMQAVVAQHDSEDLQRNPRPPLLCPQRIFFPALKVIPGRANGLSEQLRGGRKTPLSVILHIRLHPVLPIPLSDTGLVLVYKMDFGHAELT
jgi:hypothetical protein